MAKTPAPVAAPALNSTSGTAEGANTPANATPGGWPAWLLIALAVGVGWLLLLSVLALWTANPATVNRQQILQSEIVVEAEVLDPRTGKVEVEGILVDRHNLAPEDGQEIRVPLHGDHWQAGEHRILPLVKTESGEWSVTPTPLPKTPLLDYSADETLSEDIREASKTTMPPFRPSADRSSTDNRSAPSAESN